MALPLRLRLDAPGALPQWLAMGVLGLGIARLPLGELISGLAIALVLLTLLKLHEARSRRERRLVALLQLVCVGLLAALQPELGPTLLQLLATVLALAGLLALELGAGLDAMVLLRRSLQVLAAALPMALLLVLLAPRLEPFGVLPWQRGAAAVTGLSENLEPGAIERLASDRAPAARLAFPNGGGPPPEEQRYWRVLVHSEFDGRRWSSRSQSAVELLRDLELLRGLPAGSASDSGAASLGSTPTQLWLSEPSGLAFVPWSGVGQPLGRELRPQPSGELWHRGPSTQRRVYALTLQGDPERWSLLPPSPAERTYPEGVNPRLEALGRGWASLPPRQRLVEARRFFQRGGFRYTLQPGSLPEQAPLDAFLFERRAGFCGHYASATAALMRAAQLPSRVVSGYRGGSWVVPFNGGGYLDIRQADAHAWIEVWLAEEGWRRLDPTDWIGQGAARRSGQEGLRPGPLLSLQRLWWGLDIAWARWWLGYDSQAQELLLGLLLGQHRQWLGLLLLLGVGACLVGGLSWLGWLQRRAAGDRLTRELLPLLTALEGRGLGPRPGETLAAFGRRLARARPELAVDLGDLVAMVQRIRYAPPSPQPPDWRALRRLRRRLNRQLKRPAALGDARRQGLQQTIPAAGP